MQTAARDPIKRQKDSFRYIPNERGRILKAQLGNIVPQLPYQDIVINDSSITNSHLNWVERYKNWIFEQNKLKAQQEAEEAKLKAQKADQLGEHISQFGNLLINKFANKALNKNGTPASINTQQSQLDTQTINNNWNNFSTNPSLQYNYNQFKNNNSLLNGDAQNFFAKKANSQ